MLLATSSGKAAQSGTKRHKAAQSSTKRHKAAQSFSKLIAYMFGFLVNNFFGDDFMRNEKERKNIGENPRDSVPPFSRKSPISGFFQ